MIKPNFRTAILSRIFERFPGLNAAPQRLAFMLALAAASSLPAAPPPNDSCAGAITIPGGGPFPFYAPPVSLTNATTTAEVGLTNLASGFCSFPVSRGVWYTFTPATNAFYTLTTCSGSTTLGDTVMAIYVSAGGCNGPFTRLDCSDDVCGPGEFQAAISRQLLKDTTYYVVIWQWDTEPPAPDQATVQLVANRETPPPNDLCASAQTVFLNTRVTGSTVLASNDYQLSGSACFGGAGQTPVIAAGRDVAFAFTAPDSGNYSIKAYNYSFEVGFNLVLYVTGACVPGASPITLTNCLAAANRNPATTAEEIPCLPLAQGQEVFIFVDDAVGTNRGTTFALEVTRCVWETEPNNTAPSATPYACAIEGAMSPPGDSDFFALGTFPAGSRLFALLDGEAANIPDFDLRVTSLTDTLEFDDKDNDALFGQSSPNVAGTPLPGGPAFLRVNYNGAALAEPYRLYATVQPPLASAALESEPNNTPLLAGSDPRNYFFGSLAGPSPSLDADVFAFTANEGDLVFVSLDGDPLRDQTPVNAQLELLDGFGNSLALVNEANSSANTNRQPGNAGATIPTSPGEALVYRCSEGAYYVRVSISPSTSGASGAGDYLLSIAKNCLPGESGFNTAPVLASLAVSPSLEGGTAILTGHAFDPDLGDALTVMVSWGDGASDMVQSPVAGLLDLNLSHSYADDQPTGTAADTYPVMVSVVDRTGAAASASVPALVSNVAPFNLTLAPSPASVAENDLLTLQGSFSDAALTDTHQIAIQWGDGTPPTQLLLPAGATAFSIPHRYLDDNPTGTPADDYTITVTLTDDDTGTATAETMVTVTNLPPILSNVAITSPIAAGSNAVLTGTLADAGSLDHCVLTVDWGDSSPAQHWNYPAGTTGFNLSHAYATGGTNRTLTLTLIDDDDGTATATTQVTINAVAQPARFLGLSESPTGHKLLQLQGTPGATYRVEWSGDLKAWATLETKFADAAGLFSAEDAAPAPNSRFYRAVAP